mmetsp:Transcript_10849/g.16167  ORF Transcript_10849/g.16167 Transcript_10849/m.16167 type:complete len:298 (+) Transcript_10849:50-943(+)
MAKKKRATRRTRKQAKASSDSSKTKSSDSKSPLSDSELDSLLQGCLMELGHHSAASFEYAYKNYEKAGRGCLFWLFRDYKHAQQLSKLGSDLPCVSYHSAQLAQTFEYPPVLEFIKKYDPRSHFVALVAIRTGDKRDSLMKVTHLAKSAHRQAILSTKRQLTKLAFKGPNESIAWMVNGLHLCANQLCLQVEKSVDQFKKCGRCLNRAYCSRACQVLHWKAIHKSSCAAEKEWRRFEEKQSEATMLEKKELKALQEVRDLQEIEKRLAAAKMIMVQKKNETKPGREAGKPVIARPCK